jgi:hypothetical protein
MRVNWSLALLKPNPRAHTRDAFTEAEFEPDAIEVVDYAVESGVWEARSPRVDAGVGSPVFVDGVQRKDLEVLDDMPGQRPVPGMLASYAAGALAPHPRVIRDVRIGRAVVMGDGRCVDPVSAQIGTYDLSYEPYSSPKNDEAGFNSVLMALRASLEADVLVDATRDSTATVFCDGRLPPIGPTRAIGVIKNPHIMPFAEGSDHFILLSTLRTGERTPVLRRVRSGREYYAWFVCLRTPAPTQFSMGGVVMLEMDGSNAKEDVFRCADFTAARLPAYASDELRDPRAPQNLMPVGELERELRRRMGMPELVERACRIALATRSST